MMEFHQTLETHWYPQDEHLYNRKIRTRGLLPIVIHKMSVRDILFLAHLSTRLTRWAYSIPMVLRPSVVVIHRPHFQTWISLKPVGQSWSNFICSITGGGERLHKVLGQVGSKLRFPWQQKARVDFIMRKTCLHLFSVVFDPILFILAGNEDMHKTSDEFKFWPDRTTHFGVTCPWMTKILHFWTWISLKPVGQTWSNFTYSSTGGGERLHNVLRQIGTKLWCPWQQKVPIDK